MKIAVIGGGNIGTLMGADFAERGNEVRMCVSDTSAWSGEIQVFDSCDNLIKKAHMTLVTNSIEQAVTGAEAVWITYPTFMLEETAAKLLPLVTPGLRIGVVPGNDAEYFFREHIERGAVLMGLQRVHSIARLKERGKSIYELSRKPEIFVAALPSSATPMVAEELRETFGMTTVEIPNYLALTLTPSNPILHTSRIRSMFRDWTPEVTYDHNILFYEEWTMDSAELLLACDDELQQVCRRLEEELGTNLEQVRSLRDHYESPTAEAIRAKISGIPAFKGFTSPMKEAKELGRWIPDFQSRYFKADFTFGLKAIKDIAVLVGVDTPSINDVYDWYMETSADAVRFDGVPNTLEELAELYK